MLYKGGNVAEFVKCDDCPCKNSDYEDGSTCNLGYGPGYGGYIDYKQRVGGKWHLNQRYNHATREPIKVWEFSHDWVSCLPRTVCGLQHVVYREGNDFKTFTPEVITDVLEERCSGLNCEHGKLVAHE